jgi:hypothetical protein
MNKILCSDEFASTEALDAFLNFLTFMLYPRHKCKRNKNETSLTKI